MEENLKLESNSVKEENGSGSISLWDITLVLKRNWYWVFLFLFIGFVSAYSFVRWTQPKYYASSILKLEMHKEAGVIGLGLPMDETMDNYNVLSGEIEFLKSNLIYDDVIKKLNLETTYHLAGKFKDEERFENAPFKLVYDKSKTSPIYDTKIRLKFDSESEFNIGVESDGNDVNFIKGIVGDLVKIGDFSFYVETTDYFSPDLLGLPFYSVIHSYSSMQNYFSSGLDVSILNVNANTIKIGFTDINAIKASEIVNCIDSVYLNKTIENKLKAQEQTIDFINAQLDSAENRLNMAEMSIERFARNVKTYQPSSEFMNISEKIEEFKIGVKEIDKELFLIANFKEQINTEVPIESSFSAYSGIKNEQLKSSILKFNEKLKSINQLKLTYSEATMAYKKQKNELDNFKSNLKDIVEEETNLLRKEKAILLKEINNTETRFNSLPSKETELNRLKRFYNLYEKYYLSLQEKGVQFGIAKAGTVPQFVILAKAYPNFAPVSPVKSQYYLIGICIGLFFGFLLLIFRLLLQNTIVNENELKSKLKVGFLGAVPKYTRKSLTFSTIIVSENPKSSIAESFRSIRTNVEFMCSLSEKRLLGVTSTTSGEGKTFVTSNLAAIIASANKKVIILDLDMRKPKIHYCFETENNLGMSNLLAEKVSLKEVIRHSNFENLDYITAGVIPPNPTELMLRPALDEVLNELKEQYDIVIIDTPPVGIVTDANIIMKKLDLTIFVLRYEYTKKGSEQIINKIQDSKQFKSLGVVLNSVEGQLGYGYGYGQGGYGYYEEDSSDKMSKLRKIIVGK